jgi:group I intron endonuclease
MNQKAALKESCKRKQQKVGVFQIQNAVNHKVYIGSSLNLEAIWNRYKLELNMGSHRNSALQQEWKEYGEDNFRFDILSELKREEDARVDYGKEVKQLEQLVLAERLPAVERYN